MVRHESITSQRDRTRWSIPCPDTETRSSCRKRTTTRSPRRHACCETPRTPSACSLRSNGWEDNVHWQTQVRKTLKHINQLITDALRDPFAGIGRPEPLRHILSGARSRRIDDASCRKHPQVVRRSSDPRIFAVSEEHERFHANPQVGVTGSGTVLRSLRSHSPFACVLG